MLSVKNNYKNGSEDKMDTINLFCIQHIGRTSKRCCVCMNDFRDTKTPFAEETQEDVILTFGVWDFILKIWENGDETCVGFLHNNHFFSFDTPATLTNSKDIIPNDIKTYYELILNNLQREQQVVSAPTECHKKVREFLEEILFDAKTIKTCLNLINQMNSKYYLSALEYLIQNTMYAPTFVFEYSCFNEMCTFVFPILFELKKKIDTSSYPQNKLDVFEIFGNFLYGIFIWNRQHRSKEKIFVEKPLLNEYVLTECKPEFQPAFPVNNVPVILSSSDFFSPYLCVCLQSMIEHTSSDCNYDIIIIERKISESNKNSLLALQQPNIQIRFFNIEEKAQDLNFFINDNRISQETYYGLLVPWLLPLYHKAIIMDCDMIVMQDISKLFYEDLGDFVAGGVQDVILQGWLNDKNNDTAEYYDKIVRASNPFSFVNGGLLLLDFDKYRNILTQELVFHYINNYQFRVVDQDIFNLLLENKVKPLNQKWNHMILVEGAVESAIHHAPAKMQKLYFEAKRDPAIVHFASENKPWINPQIEFAQEFWKYARKTPFYEVILLRMTMQNAQRSTGENFTPVNDSRSGIRIIADVLFPKGTYRRKVLKFLLPKGSLRWRFCKQIYYIFRPQYRPENQTIRLKKGK